MQLLSVLLFVTIYKNTDSAKILAIFPTPCKSHYILGDALLRGLVSKGHHVTMMSPYNLEQSISNYNHVTIDTMGEIKQKYWSKFMNANTQPWERLFMVVEMFPILHKRIHENTNVRNFVAKGEKYDLCIVSNMMMESMYAVCNTVQAPAIGFSVVGLSSFLSYPTNNPVPYSYVPNPVLSSTDKMSFLERVLNTITWTTFDALKKFVIMPYQAKLVKKYYPNAPSLDEMVDNVDLYLMNSHIATDTPKALLPNIIPIGGFHLQIMDEIPKDIKEFLDKSKNGVIYFNLGTNAKSTDLDDHIKTAILGTFNKLDYDILWKYEGDLRNKPKNVYTERWVPQRSILMHPRVKIFMTHGGLGGIVEAIYGGVPMICMPIFGDQAKNCADSVQNGYAILLKLLDVTEESLTRSIKELESNPKYKEKISLKSDVYRNQEVNPMDRAIFWIEHVIRHKGAKHLKSTAASIPWYQYYLLDVIAFLCVVTFLGLGILKFVLLINCRLISWVVRKCISGKKNQKLKLQ